MNTIFSDRQLSHIIDQSLFFECECSAQVARQIISLRDLYAFQQDCGEQNSTDRAVHQRITTDTQQAHTLMEACLNSILMLENWNLETLTLPASSQETPQSN
ncbi:MAG: hypothetical protein A2461_05905 [Burkholderiales bacterium RIFOXYC2_FULL_59_8]|nr:MAG: hypothetical protein A2461_05905 [Burkholderiales bacterium RIFOXYC2_FULL_59_8]OGB79958.1 MAG: hypothetical protein A2496_11895 [Burkholderiales bacterium RIFOXYC12_FULL_60_6]